MAGTKGFHNIPLLILAGMLILSCQTEEKPEIEPIIDEPVKDVVVVTFNTNGGIPEPEPVSLEEGECFIDRGFPFPQDPVMEIGDSETFDPNRSLTGIEVVPSSIFDGWWYTNEDEEVLPFTAATEITEDTEVYAKWKSTQEFLMGNFVGQVKDYTNFKIINVYSDGSKKVTNNYTAVVSNSSGYGLIDPFISGRKVTVNFTSTENTAFKTSLQQVAVSKTLANTGLPVIYIDTQNGASISSKTTYVQTNIKITSDNPAHNLSSTNFPHGIRGRGNYSWDNPPKKPYRIQFDSKTSVFGLTEARSWVLIALAKDFTMLSSTVPFELARRFNMPFVHSFVHVDVVLNGTYQGQYVLMEHTQVNPGRVNIDATTGWLVELDDYYDEDVKFRAATPYYYNTQGWPAQIKSPEFSTNPNDPEYQFVINDVKEFARLLNGTTTPAFPNNGYKNLLDLDRAIDYVIVNEMCLNLEIRHPKSVFLYKEQDGKIILGPIWDFDWALGLRTTAGSPFTGNAANSVTDSSYNLTRMNTQQSNVFGRLFDDPEFRTKYRTRWNEKYNDITGMTAFMETMYEKIKVSESLDAIRWNNPPNYSRSLGFREEVNKLSKWWTNRATWLNTQIPNS